ncbi:hypothetical protein ACQFX6_15105 [Streptomyces sp. DSM 41987]|uniref:hypothetical protein n=1 Tax=Streptomyces TaxID=1883 RepID=UPI0018DF14E5|nr:hypothetical protein [Streptomyces fildesensis]
MITEWTAGGLRTPAERYTTRDSIPWAPDWTGVVAVPADDGLPDGEPPVDGGTPVPEVLGLWSPPALSEGGAPVADRS